MASPEEMAASMRANIEAKTGQSLSHWLSLIATQKLEKHGLIVKWLKSEHQITHGFANLIAHDFLNQGQPQEMDLVATQYQNKESLKPIYDAILAAMSSCTEMEIAPKKAYVSLRRKKQFALVQPSTKTRVDLGINLPDSPAGERLEASGSFNAMVSHRVRLTSADDVDAELIDWLTQAYSRA